MSIPMPNYLNVPAKPTGDLSPELPGVSRVGEDHFEAGKLSAPSRLKQAPTSGSVGVAGRRNTGFQHQRCHWRKCQ